MDAITVLMLIEALLIIIAITLYKAIRFFSPSISHAFNHVSLQSSSSLETIVAPCGVKYDVFLSFRGEDTRDTFTSHLYDAFCKAKIQTFIDNIRLEKGQEISPVLLKTIEESQIYVVIFSKDYASSTWCLNELSKIMECKHKYGRSVIPIFYNIDPSIVRKQSGSYADEFVRLEQRFKHNESKIKEWKFALTQAASLSGWDSTKNKPESKLIGKIVKDILTKLKRTSSYDFQGLVGIEHHIMNLKQILSLESSNVGIIGIWGMGGIGKTTLAEAIFQEVKAKFESYSFVSNVREHLTRYGSNHLLNKCLSQLLEDKDINSYNIRSSYVKDRLQSVKILLVLDDVDNSIQVEDIIKACDWFGIGSRIIITSRDMQVLKNLGAYQTYYVPKMDFNDSLQLFSSKAFKKIEPPRNYKELSKWVVNYYCQGIPLALKVLGCFLYGRKKEDWESALQKLEQAPLHMDVFNVLKLSFDGLDDNQKNIFLDLACFFKEAYMHNKQKIRLCYNSSVDIDLSVLRDRCLISVDKFDQIIMHDLLKAMGQEISRQQSVNEPAKSIRLWKHDEIYRVLKNNTGIERIECISLDVSKTKRIVLNTDTFRRMYNLRFLVFYKSNFFETSKVYISEDIDILSEELRIFCWDDYPLAYVPLNFCAENLVILKMQNSHLQQLWDGDQLFPNLKKINLNYSKHLVKLPDLCQTPNIEEIELSYCSSLLQICSSMPLANLWCLRLDGCSNFQSVEILSTCKKLSHFYWYQCPLQSLPLTFTYENLTFLSLLDSKVQQLWDETQKFPNLKTILLNSCEYIIRLPDLSQTPNIEEIYLNGCVNLVQVQSSSILTKLHRLMINGCNKLRLVNVGGNTHGRISSRLVAVYNYFDLKSFSFIRVKVKVFMSNDDDGGSSSFGLKVESVPFKEYNDSTELKLLGQSFSSLLPFVSQVRWLDVTSSIDSHFEMNLSHFPYDGQKNQVPKVTELQLEGRPCAPGSHKVESGKDQMYAALPLQAERLFSGFESVTSMSHGSNLTFAPELQGLLHPWMKETVAEEVKIGLESLKEDDCCVISDLLIRVPKSITCWSLLTEFSLQKSEIESSVGGNILGLSALKSFGECDCSRLEPPKDVTFSVNASTIVITHSQQLYHIDSRIFVCNIKVDVSKLSFEFLEWPYCEEEDAYRWLVHRYQLLYLKVPMWFDINGQEYYEKNSRFTHGRKFEYL